MNTNIITVKTNSGEVLLVVPDGTGGVVYRKLNGELYSTEICCEDLTLHCCKDENNILNINVNV